jgi:hypothetical protein
MIFLVYTICLAAILFEYVLQSFTYHFSKYVPMAMIGMFSIHS